MYLASVCVADVNLSDFRILTVCWYFMCQQLEQPVLPCSCHITDFTICNMLLFIAIFGE